MYRVFVTGLGGCGVGEGIVKALQREQYEIYGSDISPHFPLKNALKASFTVPDANHEKYIEIIKDICIGNNITAIYPGSEIETKVISCNRDIFESANITPMINSPDIIKTFLDSWQTYNLLKSYNFDVPPTCRPNNYVDFIDKFNYPVIIKPIFGHGSKHVHLAQNDSELKFHLEQFKTARLDCIIQKYVGDEEEEYTVGIFSDKNERIISSIAMKRSMLAGATLTAYIKAYTKIEDYCSRAAMALRSKGPLNFQIRRDGDRFYIFEINPRFSGTTPFRAMVGINEPHMMYRHYVLNSELTPVKYQTNKVIMRMFNEVMLNLE